MLPFQLFSFSFPIIIIFIIAFGNGIQSVLGNDEAEKKIIHELLKFQDISSFTEQHRTHITFNFIKRLGASVIKDQKLSKTLIMFNSQLRDHLSEQGDSHLAFSWYRLYQLLDSIPENGKDGKEHLQGSHVDSELILASCSYLFQRPIKDKLSLSTFQLIHKQFKRIIDSEPMKWNEVVQTFEFIIKKAFEFEENFKGIKLNQENLLSDPSSPSSIWSFLSLTDKSWFHQLGESIKKGKNSDFNDSVAFTLLTCDNQENDQIQNKEIQIEDSEDDEGEITGMKSIENPFQASISSSCQKDLYHIFQRAIIEMLHEEFTGKSIFFDSLTVSHILSILDFYIPIHSRTPHVLNSLIKENVEFRKWIQELFVNPTMHHSIYNLLLTLHYQKDEIERIKTRPSLKDNIASRILFYGSPDRFDQHYEIKKFIKDEWKLQLFYLSLNDHFSKKLPLVPISLIEEILLLRKEGEKAKEKRGKGKKEMEESTIKEEFENSPLKEGGEKIVNGKEKISPFESKEKKLIMEYRGDLVLINGLGGGGKLSLVRAYLSDPILDSKTKFESILHVTRLASPFPFPNSLSFSTSSTSSLDSSVDFKKILNQLESATKYSELLRILKKNLASGSLERWNAMELFQSSSKRDKMGRISSSPPFTFISDSSLIDQFSSEDVKILSDLNAIMKSFKNLKKSALDSLKSIGSLFGTDQIPFKRILKMSNNQAAFTMRSIQIGILEYKGHGWIKSVIDQSIRRATPFKIKNKIQLSDYYHHEIEKETWNPNQKINESNENSNENQEKEALIGKSISSKKKISFKELLQEQLIEGSGGFYICHELLMDEEGRDEISPEACIDSLNLIFYYLFPRKEEYANMRLLISRLNMIPLYTIIVNYNIERIETMESIDNEEMERETRENLKALWISQSCPIGNEVAQIMISKINNNPSITSRIDFANYKCDKETIFKITSK